MPDLKPGYNWIRTPGTPTLPSCVIASQRVGAERRPMINFREAIQKPQPGTGLLRRLLADFRFRRLH